MTTTPAASVPAACWRHSLNGQMSSWWWGAGAIPVLVVLVGGRQGPAQKGQQLLWPSSCSCSCSQSCCRLISHQQRQQPHDQLPQGPLLSTTRTTGGVSRVQQQQEEGEERALVGVCLLPLLLPSQQGRQQAGCSSAGSSRGSWWCPRQQGGAITRTTTGHQQVRHSVLRSSVFGVLCRWMVRRRAHKLPLTV